MRIQDLFTVPEGKKVTPRLFGRVLLSSVCGILLCIACLVSTTYAWFSTTIDNADNVIQIATPNVALQVNGGSGMQLIAGTNTVSIAHTAAPDDFQHRSTLYVTLTLNETASYTCVLSAANGYQQQITVDTDVPCTLTYEVSWFAPAGAIMLTDNVIEVQTEEETEPPADPAEQTDPTDPTVETNPTDPTAETDPADPTAETDPTDPTAETDPQVTE